ncbi:hypothetical protein WM94_27700 [Pseudomonas sp. ABFPK]|nr:hypothetical protein WM94_27700 [Pseudomonas sp. ABFPK]
MGMVMIFGGREQLHQLCVALERLKVEGVELSSRERSPAPDILQELLAEGALQQSSSLHR